MRHNAICPVCEGTDTGNPCQTCGNEMFLYLHEPPATEYAKLERLRQEWRAKNFNWLAVWDKHEYELPYRIEVKYPGILGAGESKLLVNFNGIVKIPLKLPETVLVGCSSMIPDTPANGTKLFTWPAAAVTIGTDGGQLEAPLNILRGSTWVLRLFMANESDARKIRLIHGRTEEMTIHGKIST